MAILPSVVRSSRKATWRTDVSFSPDHWVSLGAKAPSASCATLSGRATALPGPLSSAQITTTAATIATAPPAAIQRRLRLMRETRGWPTIVMGNAFRNRHKREADEIANSLFVLL